MELTNLGFFFDYPFDADGNAYVFCKSNIGELGNRLNDESKRGVLATAEAVCERMAVPIFTDKVDFTQSIARSINLSDYEQLNPIPSRFSSHTSRTSIGSNISSPFASAFLFKDLAISAFNLLFTIPSLSLSEDYKHTYTEGGEEKSEYIDVSIAFIGNSTSFIDAISYFTSLDTNPDWYQNSDMTDTDSPVIKYFNPYTQLNGDMRLNLYEITQNSIWKKTSKNKYGSNGHAWYRGSARDYSTVLDSLIKGYFTTILGMFTQITADKIDEGDSETTNPNDIGFCRHHYGSWSYHTNSGSGTQEYWRIYTRSDFNDRMNKLGYNFLSKEFLTLRGFNFWDVNLGANIATGPTNISQRRISFAMGLVQQMLVDYNNTVIRLPYECYFKTYSVRYKRDTLIKYENGEFIVSSESASVKDYELDTEDQNNLGSKYWTSCETGITASLRRSITSDSPSGDDETTNEWMWTSNPGDSFFTGNEVELTTVVHGYEQTDSVEFADPGSEGKTVSSYTSYQGPYAVEDIAVAQSYPSEGVCDRYVSQCSMSFFERVQDGRDLNNAGTDPDHYIGVKTYTSTSGNMSWTNLIKSRAELSLDKFSEKKNPTLKPFQEYDYKDASAKTLNYTTSGTMSSMSFLYQIDQSPSYMFTDKTGTASWVYAPYAVKCYMSNGTTLTYTITWTEDSSTGTYHGEVAFNIQTMQIPVFVAATESELKHGHTDAIGCIRWNWKVLPQDD